MNIDDDVKMLMNQQFEVNAVDIFFTKLKILENVSDDFLTKCFLAVDSDDLRYFIVSEIVSRGVHSKEIECHAKNIFSNFDFENASASQLLVITSASSFAKKLDDDMLKFLSLCLESGNIIIRNSASVSIQKYLDVKTIDLDWGDEHRDISEIGRRLLKLP